MLGVVVPSRFVPSINCFRETESASPSVFTIGYKVRLRRAAGPTTAGFQFRSTLHSGFPSRPLPSFASRVFKTCVTLVTKADSVYYRYKMGFPEIWVTRGLCYFLPSLSPKPTGRSTRMSPSFPRTPRIISSSEACHLRYTMS